MLKVKKSTTESIGNKLRKWNLTPVTENKKKYEYIPELMKSVRLMCQQTTSTLHSKNVLAEDHPSQQQATIAHTVPSSTDELISNKRSRFH